MSTRRDFLGCTAGAVAAGTILPVAAEAAPHPVGVPASHPDADLIRLCAEHVVNLRASNASQEANCDKDPLWKAYKLTRDAITAAQPRTLAGMQAKARAAKAEAQLPDGRENLECTPGEWWAWQLVNDLVDGRAGG